MAEAARHDVTLTSLKLEVIGAGRDVDELPFSDRSSAEGLGKVLQGAEQDLLPFPFQAVSWNLCLFSSLHPECSAAAILLQWL